MPGSVGAADKSPPRLPCGGITGPQPAYADVGAPVAVTVWYGDDPVAAAWNPLPCSGWKKAPFTLLVATAGRFRHAAGTDGLVPRVAAISALTGVRYWSVTRGRWHDLISEAFALSGPDPATRRADFSPDELTPGTVLYFWQNESTPAGGVTYRLEVRERTPERLVLAVENAAPVKLLFLTLFDPGAYQFLYILERESAEVWNYYGLIRVGGGAVAAARRHEASYINRAVAMFRYLAGLPTDGAPPQAP